MIFEYVVSFHNALQEYQEGLFTTQSPVSIGHHILWPNDGLEYRVFHVVHSPGGTRLHIKLADV